MDKESSGMLNADLLQKFAALAGLVILIIVFSMTARNFLSVANMINITLQTTTFALAGIGVTFVIITGGIDLSIGSVLALSGVTAGLLAQKGVPVPISFAVAVVVGMICGFLNASMINYIKLPPFIATLGMMMIVRGTGLLLTDARNISDLPQSFGSLGNSAFFKITHIDDNGKTITDFVGIPWAVIMLLILALIFHYALSCTKFGRYVYAVGSNEEATRLSGINVVRVKFWAYSFCGGFAALAGIVTMSRLITAQPTAGESFELDAIASAVIGGTSLMGGVGTISGTIIGAFIIGVLRNGLNMLGVQSFVQKIIVGLVIIIAVTIDQLRNRKRV